MKFTSILFFVLSSAGVYADSVEVRNDMSIKVTVSCSGSSNVTLSSGGSTTCSSSSGPTIEPQDNSCDSYNRGVSDEYYVENCRGFSQTVTDDCTGDTSKVAEIGLTGVYGNNQVELDTWCELPE